MTLATLLLVSLSSNATTLDATAWAAEPAPCEHGERTGCARVKRQDGSAVTLRDVLEDTGQLETLANYAERNPDHPYALGTILGLGGALAAAGAIVVAGFGAATVGALLYGLHAGQLLRTSGAPVLEDFSRTGFLLAGGGLLALFGAAALGATAAAWVWRLVRPPPPTQAAQQAAGEAAVIPEALAQSAVAAHNARVEDATRVPPAPATATDIPLDAPPAEPTPMALEPDGVAPVPAQ